ncbi:MAG: class I SAM-dependent methyltransferase [Clostridia bacterium]|nr:class I SAM-dependent methyltransferase [Clostridia bacterium]
MLNNHGFDIWADNYDKSVNATDGGNEYPFAGYKRIMNAIYNTVMEKCPMKILDVGIGTGILATRLYDNGNDITGIDFSSKMLEKAKEKMPKSKLIQFDFTKGLPPEITGETYDFIISTYALHHLTDDEKISFIISLLNHISETGVIIIGDVCFQNRDDMEKCQELCGDEWDDEEFYFVFSELNDKLNTFCMLSYHQISHCGGVMVIRRFD